MNELIVIGIDSLSPELLVKFEQNLPNFNKLREKSPDFKLDSIFPVDSVPAWVSIYTGLNPAEHGIVKTFDVFDSNLNDVLSVNTSVFKGKTFWDHLGRCGKKVCVLFPLLAFPPWEVNGIMVSKAIKEQKIKGEPEWIIEKEVRSNPEWCIDKYGIPKFMKGVSGKHPGKRNLIKWSECAKESLIEEANIGIELCKNEEWDLFFIYFSWLDIIQHRLWKYSDESDPSWRPNNPYMDIIRGFYEELDRIVGSYLDIYPDATYIILSDHGHGMRPTKVININKILNENNLLSIDTKRNNPLPYILEKIKILTLDFVSEFELDKWLVDLSTKTRFMSSLSKGVYMSTASLEKSKTLAHLSAFAGVKSYPHGGIEINLNNLDADLDYEKLRDRIINLLLELKDPMNDEQLVEWACRREDLYQGKNVSVSYPDIVFLLKEGYGTGWNIYSSLVSRAYDHSLASGGHKKNAVFLISGNSKKIKRSNMTLMDIAPLILDLLGVDS